MPTPALPPLYKAELSPISSPAQVRTALWRRIWRNKALTAGGAVLLIILLLAIFAPWISPHDPYAQDLAHRVVPPVWYDKGSW
ncbi:MAG TPA: ABC transporter permease, partial [Paralcaligenes sp.]